MYVYVCVYIYIYIHMHILILAGNTPHCDPTPFDTGNQVLEVYRALQAAC